MNTLEIANQVLTYNPQDDPIDAQILNELRDTIGEELSVEIISTYLEYVPGQLTKMQEAADRKDVQALWHAAHAFKSSSRSVGASQVGNLCEQMELWGRAGEVEAILKLLPTLQQECEKVVAYLSKEIL
jgi:HPt (histidine-containing phosphotransfer) domain-containing protein